MAANESVEIRMADLIPKTKRVDAIQCFVSRETPIVRIADADADADGAVGVGYSLRLARAVLRSSNSSPARWRQR